MGIETEQAETGSDVELGEEAQGGDPFSDVDPLSGAPSDRVQPGSLPGYNPSEEGEEGPEDEPEPELVPDDERDAAPEEDEYPAAEEPAPEPEVEEPEPVADVEPEKPKPQSEEPGTSKSSTKRSKSNKSKSKATPTRGYVILMEGSSPGVWEEAFERPDKKSDEPFTLVCRNGTAALRKAYRLLTDDGKNPQDYTLVPVPEKLWKPKKVSGRVHKQTAITVG